MGHDWRDDLQQHVRGGVEQVERDADTFFKIDVPALLSWQFTAEDARQIHQPTLYVGGTASGPWFSEVRTLMPDWLSQPEDVAIQGADHNLVATHPEVTSRVLTEFISRHPISQ